MYPRMVEQLRTFCCLRDIQVEMVSPSRGATGCFPGAVVPKSPRRPRNLQGSSAGQVSWMKGLRIWLPVGLPCGSPSSSSLETDSDPAAIGRLPERMLWGQRPRSTSARIASASRPAVTRPSSSASASVETRLARRPAYGRAMRVGRAGRARWFRQSGSVGGEAVGVGTGRRLGAREGHRGAQRGCLLVEPGLQLGQRLAREAAGAVGDHDDLEGRGCRAAAGARRLSPPWPGC